MYVCERGGSLCVCMCIFMRICRDLMHGVEDGGELNRRGCSSDATKQQ